MGHEVAPGAGYGGYPGAHHAMPFNDQYGGGGYGQQPGAFGAPPPGQAPGYGDQQPYGQQLGGFGFGAPHGGQQPGGAPPAYGGAAPPGFGAPSLGQAQGFGNQGGFSPPQPGAYGSPAALEVAPPAPALPPNALRGFLVSYQSNTQGDFWPLLGGRKTLGRANSGEQVDIPLSDATISSRHAALIVDGTHGTIQIEDTGSTNGTFVNEEHIGFNGKRELRDGDRIRFGGYTTVVKVISRL